MKVMLEIASNKLGDKYYWAKIEEAGFTHERGQVRIETPFGDKQEVTACFVTLHDFEPLTDLAVMFDNPIILSKGGMTTWNMIDKSGWVLTVYDAWIE